MRLITDDIVLAVAAFLSSRDLVNLSRTCRRFGGNPACREGKAGRASTKKRARRGRKGKRKKADSTEEVMAQVSLVNSFARQQVLDATAEEDEDWGHLLKKKYGESWIAPYHRLIHLRCSLVFSSFLGSGLRHVNNDLSHIEAKKKHMKIFKWSNPFDPPWLAPSNCTYATAKCNEVMISKSGGKHYAIFTVMWPGREADIQIGIIRPMRGWTEKKFHYRGFDDFCNSKSQTAGYEGNVHRCLFSLRMGYLSIHTSSPDPDPIRWYDGNLAKEGSKVGLLLDLDKGELRAYVDGKPTGPMILGLAGDYCWNVAIRASPSWSREHSSFVWDETAVRVDRAPVPEFCASGQFLSAIM